MVRMGLEMVLGFGLQRSQPGEGADSRLFYEHSEMRWFCGVSVVLIVVAGVAALAGTRRIRVAGR